MTNRFTVSLLQHLSTFADSVITFNQSLQLKKKLPAGIRVMNPFIEYAHVPEISAAFYKKYYDDNRKRKFIIGINPGRFGAGLTGIPFTDPKRLVDVCGIRYPGKTAHEPSSVFIYDMIAAFGGPEKFYSKFYINSICPLGFTAENDRGRVVNYNYYDSRALLDCTREFILNTLKQQIELGLETKVCYCLGTGKNYGHLSALNDQYSFFGRIVPLAHPRFIMQYKSKVKQEYIAQYLEVLQ